MTEKKITIRWIADFNHENLKQLLETTGGHVEIASVNEDGECLKYFRLTRQPEAWADPKGFAEIERIASVMLADQKGETK